MQKKCSLCQVIKRSKVGFFIFSGYVFSLFVWGQVELIKYVHDLIVKFL